MHWQLNKSEIEYAKQHNKKINYLEQKAKGCSDEKIYILNWN